MRSKALFCRRFTLLMAAAALIVLSLSACGTLAVGVEPTRTSAATVASTRVEPTATASVQPSPSAAATAAPSATPRPSAAATAASSATPRPSATPQPTARPTSTAAPATPAGTVDRVKVGLITLEDNAKSGKAVGCGDSVVTAERRIAPTQAPLKAALQELFSIREQFLGQSGLYNALYQSNLKVESATIVGGKATVQLSGRLLLGGVCDNPRVEAQIRETALQFPTVREVAVFVNGTPLSQVLSQKG